MLKPEGEQFPLAAAKIQKSKRIICLSLFALMFYDTIQYNH